MGRIPSVLSEKQMEDQIARDPARFLKEKGLKLIARQITVVPYRFDLLFEDRHGTKLIVELQKGTLDRNHTYKILDYYEEFKDRNKTEFIELMIIANSVPRERKQRLEKWGVTWLEIPETEFDQSEEQLQTQFQPQSDDPRKKEIIGGVTTGTVQIGQTAITNEMMAYWSGQRERDCFGFKGRRACMACLYSRPEGASQKEVTEIAEILGGPQKGYYNMLKQALKWNHEVVSWYDDSRGGKIFKLIYNPTHSSSTQTEPSYDYREMNEIRAPDGAFIEKMSP